MKHRIIPYVSQNHPGVDWHYPETAGTAVELHFPNTFSRKAWRVIEHFRGDMFLYAYNGHFVVTDQSRELAYYACPQSKSPHLGPECIACTLAEVERWLEDIADSYDDPEVAIAGWRPKLTARTAQYDLERPLGEEDVKVDLTPHGQFIGINTYDRKHGKHERFLVYQETLEQMLTPSANSRREEDCGHYLTISRLKDALHFRITWLNSYSDSSVNGFQQDFLIPILLVGAMLEEERSITYLYSPPPGGARIAARPAAKTISRIAEDKRLRRAFSKAMRDCFNWPGEKITLYPDGKYSFFFTTASGFPKNGGLVLHEGEKNGRRYVYYSVHT